MAEPRIDVFRPIQRPTVDRIARQGGAGQVSGPAPGGGGGENGR